MGGAQIDRFGNINATVIGEYEHPKVRLPGSGGSKEIAAWANRCYIMTPIKNAVSREVRFHHFRRIPGRAHQAQKQQLFVAAVLKLWSLISAFWNPMKTEN